MNNIQKMLEGENTNGITTETGTETVTSTETLSPKEMFRKEWARRASLSEEQNVFYHIRTTSGERFPYNLTKLNGTFAQNQFLLAARDWIKLAVSKGTIALTQEAASHPLGIHGPNTVYYVWSHDYVVDETVPVLNIVAVYQSATIVIKLHEWFCWFHQISLYDCVDEHGHINPTTLFNHFQAHNFCVSVTKYTNTNSMLSKKFPEDLNSVAEYLIYQMCSVIAHSFVYEYNDTERSREEREI